MLEDERDQLEMQVRQRTATQMAQAKSHFGFERIVRAPGSPLDLLCRMAERAGARLTLTNADGGGLIAILAFHAPEREQGRWSA